MSADVPVAGKESEGQPRPGIGSTGIGDEMVEKNEAIEDRKVERPDSQNAAHVKRSNVDPSKAISLAHQQFSDQECAEQKEDRHAKVTEETDVIKPEMPCRINGQMIQAMYREDAEKRKKA